MRLAAFIASSAVGKVDMTSSPMVLMTVPLIGLGGLAHDVEATAHHLPSFDVAELFVKLRAAHHVGEQNRNLHILTHGFLLECARGEPRRL